MNQLRESEKSILSNHRDELKEIMRVGSVWLSERAMIIAIVTIEAVIFLLGTVAYYYAKAKFT